jgi:hypothetical protein
MILALLVSILGKSLLYRRKNSGPRIENCGSLWLTISHPEEVLLITVALLSKA